MPPMGPPHRPEYQIGKDQSFIPTVIMIASIVLPLPLHLRNEPRKYLAVLATRKHVHLNKWGLF